MNTRIHRPLKVVPFNANGITRQHYELSKQLHTSRTDVALLLETHLKPHERFCITNYHIYRNVRHTAAKGGNAIAVRKAVPHNYVEISPPLISIGTTGVSIPVGKKEILLAAVYKSPSRDWSDTDIDELLGLRNKAVLAGDLNATHPAWNSQIANIAVTRILNLQDKSDFQISAPRYPTHYTPSGNGDVLDVVLHRNVRISDINKLEILESDHLPILYHMLDHVSTRDKSAPIEIHTDWEQFQSLALILIAPTTQIHTSEDAEDAARKFAASIASPYRLPTHKIANLKLNEELTELDKLLQLKRRLRK
jgi:endonuclease/exonuclease/phosphatase (EEP) superfamily protein YafD